MSLISHLANAITRTRRPLSFAPCAHNPFQRFRRQPRFSSDFCPRFVALSRLIVEGAELLLEALSDSCQRTRYRLQAEAQSAVEQEIARLDSCTEPRLIELSDLYVKLALASDAAGEASRTLERIVVSANDTTGRSDTWI